MGKDKPFIVACIPAYNEEKTIAKVIVKAMNHVDKVLVCDDGSTDMTAEIAKRLGAEVIRHERNMGKGAALRTLFMRAEELSSDVIVTLDGDGQHDPSEIPKIIDPIVRGEADMVVGSRFISGSWMDAPLYRRFGLRLINLFSKKEVKDVVRDTQSGFRAYSSKLLNLVRNCEVDGYGVEMEQLVVAVKNGFRVVEVPVTVKYEGLERTSKRNPVRHGAEIIGTALRLVVEERPLFFLGIPGFLLIVAGLFAGAYLFWYFNMTRYFSVPIALITLGSLFLGAMFLITSLLLYAIRRLKKDIQKK